jgi:hypothetical protein
MILVLQLALATIAVLALPVAAVPRFQTGTPALTGELRIAGSRLLDGPVRRWVAIFRREHPAVRVKVALAGSAAGVRAMEQGRADAAPLMHLLNRDEQALFSESAAPHGIPLGQGRLFRVATGEVSGDVPIYLYLNQPAGRSVSAAAVELARIATSAEGSGRARVTLFEALARRAGL